ncbi:MAG TPA: hypothetical protein VK524_20340 [Polyangiaceae bacterium]|nr:hypothetical protein [Polyangiaceae bacterium]
MIPALCIGCGCDDDHACGGGCTWLRIDRDECIGVCSSCPQFEARWDAGDRDLSDVAMEHAAELATEDAPEESGLILPGDVTYADTLRYLRGSVR